MFSAHPDDGGTCVYKYYVKDSSPAGQRTVVTSQTSYCRSNNLHWWRTEEINSKTIQFEIKTRKMCPVQGNEDLWNTISFLCFSWNSCSWYLNERWLGLIICTCCISYICHIVSPLLVTHQKVCVSFKNIKWREKTTFQSTSLTQQETTRSTQPSAFTKEVGIN